MTGSVPADTKLSQLGERYLVRYIVSRLGTPQNSILQPGDDAAGFLWTGGLVTCMDVLVAETDVPPGMGWERAGWKAVVAAISDLASKSAKPVYLLTGLGLSPEMTFRDFTELWSGIEKAAEHYGASIIGGDVNECSRPFVAVTAMGETSKPLTRYGARPGDLVACTGLFGATAAGLHAVLKGNTAEADPRLLEKVYTPQARLTEGLTLGRVGGVTSCIDSSDGLAESLHCIAEASGVGVVLTSEPVDPLAIRYAEENSLDIFQLVMYGGEEYELVFTFSEGRLDVLREGLGDRLHVIGKVVAGSGVFLDRGGVRVEIPRLGWEHFREAHP
ncbi:Thiamine-monophosphate kinase [archaeon HR01]|nr:Thiamine-monophosphate kinase [archaeon HR01]